MVGPIREATIGAHPIRNRQTGLHHHFDKAKQRIEFLTGMALEGPRDEI